MKALRTERTALKGRVFPALALVIFLTVLVLLCLTADRLEKKHGLRVDCSFNAVTTQSEKTLEILAELDKPVHIYALFTKGQEDAPLMELLDRYASASPLVTWEHADVNLNPSLTARFGGDTQETAITNDSVIVSCDTTGRYRVLSPADFVSLSLDYENGVYEIAGLTYESSLTSAIRYVSVDEVPVIRFLTGHGELTREEAAAYADLLERNQYETADLNLLETEPDPDDRLIVILSPQRDLMDSELKQLTAFADRGGSFLFTADYQDHLENMPNYTALLRAYGILPLEGIVVAAADEPDTFYENYRIDLLPEMCPTDVTLQLIETGASTMLLAGSRAFETPGDTDRNLTAMEMLRSGEGAYLKQVNDNSFSLEKKEGDLTGPFSLAIEARRTTAGGFISRAVALGSSPLLTSEQLMTMTDDQEFLMRVTEYLQDTAASDLGIMARLALRPALSARSTAAGSILLVALPVAVLVAGIAVLYPRRRRT